MGYHVDLEELGNCQARLATIQQHAADLLTLAADADPEWYIWGLVGAPFAAWYWHFAEELYKHLDEMGTALADHVDALDCTKASYAATEQAITKSLQTIHEKLG
jgi:hypothetical protein